MKKVLSVILTMAMLLSMFSCLFTTSAAAETSNSVVVQDFETGWADSVNGSAIERYNTKSYGAVLTENDGANTFVRFRSSGKWLRCITYPQALDAKEDATYNLTFKYRVAENVGNANSTPVRIVAEGNDLNSTAIDNDNKTCTEGNNGGSNINGITVTYDANDTTTWKTATIYNFLRYDDNGYFRVWLPGNGHNDNDKYVSVDFDDFAFTKAVTASATANGVGTAKVNNTKPVYGTEMVYTAKTANTFLGWFDGVNPDPVSTNEVYTFTYNGTQPVALTAKFEGDDKMVQDFEGITYLNANNGTQRNPDNVTDGNKNSHGTITTEENGNTYLAISDSGKWVRYVNNIAETGGLLQVGTQYTISFKYRLKAGACASPAGKTVKICFFNHSAASYPQNSTTTVTLTYDASKENEWRTATIDNASIISETLTSGYAQIQIPGNTMIDVDLDDITFEKVVSTSVTVEGKLGTASVDKAEVKVGDTVTYTATEYLAGAFLGWYDSKGEVSADKEYTFTYDGTQELDLTAKFRTDIIAQTFETGWAVKEGTSNQIPRDPDNKTSKTTYGTIETENGNKYLKITIGDNGTWLHYAINEKETGLLDTEDTLYSVTFKYKVLTETDKEIRVFFWGQNDDGNTNQDWNTITFNGGTRATGVKLNYTAEAAGTWQTATINNVITDGYTTGRLAALVTNAPGVQFAIDEIVFTEYKEEPAVSTSVTVEGTTGNATVDKAEVMVGDTVTYTATENIAGAFLGWYNGETLVSDALVYSFEYDGTKALDLTAKFATAYATSVTVDGKLGTAAVDNAQVVKGNTVTYTATEYLADAFLGWYNGETLVSADKVYTFAYDGTQALGLTAKFRTDIIAQTFETGWDSSDRKPADNLTSKPYAPVASTEANGNKYIQVEASGKWLHYVINEAETGLLDTEKKYNVTFKYKILTETENAVHVFFWNESETGNVTQDWSSITSNGGGNAKGVKLEYSAEAADTWQTATIYNVKTEDYTTGRLAAHVANATGVQFAIDDIIFTETFIANANAEGAGSAEVSKRYVEKGDTVTFTATANDNGEFVAWLDAEGNEVSTDATYTVANFDGTQVINLTAKFKTLVSASATVDNPENGEATCVVEGDTVTFTAAEVREDSFIGWFDAEGNFVDGNKSFNVVYNGTELAYTAKFKNADGTFDTDAFDKAFNAQFVEFNGTAIRAQDGDKPQALRFKTTIKARDMLAESGFVGMQVVEYGTLIGNTKKLAGAELTHATEGHLIGVAYNSAEDKDIVFENNNGDIQFTAALTGIKAKNYGDRLTMRAYIIVSDGENTYTIYADEYEYSVYDVMYAITISGNTDDIAIVNAILNADADVKAKFEEYVTVNFPQ